MPVADILLVATSPLRLDPQVAQTTPHVSKALEVAPGISLAGVKREIAEWVMANTGFRSPHHREISAMYAFVRYDPPGRYWDEDRAISTVLFLSHFVRATEAGLEFTARIETDERGRLLSIVPSDIEPVYARAYCAPAVRRRWLTQDDALLLRRVVAAYTALKPTLEGTRLGAAVSAFGDVPFIFQGKSRAQLVTTALEGLVSTGRERATKQFTARIPALAAAVGLGHLDEAWADDMYKLRSKLAHGTPLLQAADEATKQTKRDEFNDALAGLEELLRRVLRTALLEPPFRSRLENVDLHWPVPGVACAACRSRDPRLIALACPRCGQPWS